MKRLLVAFGFLTRLPVGAQALGPADLGRATLAFPVVGAFIGFFQWGLYAALGALGRPPDPWLFAALAVVVSTALTGGLHLDGLADTLDGVAGGRTHEDVRRIMKDPAIGAFGAAGVALALGARIVCLARLSEWGGFALVVTAPVLSRLSAVVLAFSGGTGVGSVARPAAGDGDAGSARTPLGQRLREGLGRAELFGAGFFALGSCWLALTLFPSQGAPMGLLGAGFGTVAAWLLMRRLARTRVGAVTGDVLGAEIELSEVTALLVGALALGTGSQPQGSFSTAAHVASLIAALAAQPLLDAV